MDIGSFSLNDPSLTDAQKICYIQGVTAGGDNEYDGHIGVRVSALFVILLTSSLATFFPVVARRIRWVRIPLGVYLFARYFGTGVIIATAYIHLLDPAYSAIGPNTCVGMTGGWSAYSFVPAIVLTTIMIIFFMDFGAKLYVEKKYGMLEDHGSHDPESMITSQPDGVHTHNGHIHDAHANYGHGQNEVDMSDLSSEPKHHSPQVDKNSLGMTEQAPMSAERLCDDEFDEKDGAAVQRSFERQIAAFYILEFGVIFHSVIIGLNLAVAGWDEFKVLYIVIIFHQSFEGLGVGARMSAIPFPKHLRKMPWMLCAAYGLTTPLAVAIGLGVRTTYNPNSFTANVVSGVLDSTSAGILIYTGLVELLAADFLFNPERTKNVKRLTFMLSCVVLGAATMALLGKWA